MSEREEDADSKPFDPTPRRLQRSREEGDAIRSEDMQTALATFSIALALAGLGAWAFSESLSLSVGLLRNLATIRLEDAQSGSRLWLLSSQTVLPLLPLLLVPALLVIFWLILSKGWVFAPTRLLPKLSRLSILQTAKQKFGRAGLVDFLKRSVKLTLLGAILVGFLQARLDWLVQSLWLDPRQITLLLARLMLEFLFLGAFVLLAIGGLDFLWQRREFLRRNRMSRKDMSEEMKESEGDPHIKADRRRRAQEVANRRMMAEVPKSDVVIVNPKHYAVALKWDRSRGGAPVCVAKGVDDVAARIRALAQEAGVPIYRDPKTARKLFAELDIGTEIRREQYAAVAAAIRFADAMRQKAGRLSAAKRARERPK